MPVEQLRVIAKGRLAGAVETRNIFDYSSEGSTPTNEDIANVWGQVAQGVFSTALFDILAPAFAIYEFETQHKQGDDWVTVDSHPDTRVGGSLSEFVAFQTAFRIGAKTGAKRVRGSKFFAGLAEGAISGGSLTAGALAVAADIALAYILPVEGTDGRLWYPGVVTKTGGIAQFVSATADSILSTMRRRKPGYGI